MDGRTDGLEIFLIDIMDFEQFWDTYNPDPAFANRRAATEREWQRCAPAKQQAIALWLQQHRPPQGRNPYFFVQDFVAKQQMLSYADYYARFGTTEPQDGWQRVFIPEQQKTIYVKQ